MRCRWIIAMGIAAMVAASEWVDPARVTGQAQTSSTKPWTPPRTGWGHPDLQGVWNYASDTPMERPAEFGNRAFLTDEEVAKRAQATIERRFKQDNRQSAVEAGPAGLEGAGGNYNRFWTDHPRASRQTSFVIDPPDGKIPPHTPAAKRSYAELEKIRKGIDLDAPTPGGFVEDLGPRGLFTRCILSFNSGPPMTPCCYNENVQIFQTPDHVVLLNEIVHSTRIIPLDGRPHVSQAIRQWMGDSRGRWENNTLVVTTTNFKDIVFDVGGRTRPNGEGLILVERFTRAADDTLQYQFTINDPAWYTAPWTAQIPMLKTPERLFEYACHEGNYSLINILAGARAKEQKAASEAEKRER